MPWSSNICWSALLSQLRCDKAGAATLEFALVATSMIMVMLNGVEAARYYYGKIEIQNATQMASQAVWKLCNTKAKLPTDTACAGRNTKITTSLQATSLGNAVTLSTGFPTEGWFCINSGTGVLQSAGSTQPTNCSAYGGTSGQTPGYYVTIQAQYAYTPILPAFTIGSSLPTPVTAKTVTRLQ